MKESYWILGYLNIGVSSSVIAQAVSRWLFTAAGRVRIRV
jgi:hypothetical protein